MDMVIIKSKLWNPNPKTKYFMNQCAFPKSSSQTFVNPPMAHSIEMNSRGDKLMVGCGDGKIYWITTGGLKITQKFEVSLGCVQKVGYFNHDSLYLIGTPNQLQCRSSCAYETIFARDFNGINDFCANETTKQILVCDNSTNVYLFDSVEENEDEEM